MRATLYLPAISMRREAGIGANQRELKSTTVRAGSRILKTWLLVGAGVLLHLIWRERGAGGVPAGRIADETREVADKKDDLVAQLLKLAHLVEEHRVPEMQIRRRRIEARLHAQRLPLFSFRRSSDSTSTSRAPRLISASCESNSLMAGHSWTLRRKDA